jgi:hypothetical protein
MIFIAIDALSSFNRRCTCAVIVWIRASCAASFIFAWFFNVYSLMKAWSAITCWSRHWILEFLNSESDLIVDLSFLISFRKSYHFQFITIVLRARSLLVDWDSCHFRSKDESTLISLYSFNHRSEDENHSTAKKQTFETSNFATKQSIDSAK